MLTQSDVSSLCDITDLNQLQVELNRLPSPDVGDYITQLPLERKVSTFGLLGSEQAIEVFEYLPLCVQEELLGSLPKELVLQVMEAISPDERAFLFDELPDAMVLHLHEQLSEAEQQATSTILDYPEDTAGRVMTTEYVRLQEGLTVGEALSKISLSDRDKETVYYAYVTDDNDKLVRIVSLRQLIFSIPDALIKDIASKHVIKVRTEMPQEEVARLMKRYDLLALPVVDQEDRLVGIVTIDDVVDILEEEATEDFQKLAGVSGGDEDVLAEPLETIKKRLPWLLGVMVLYIGAANAIAPFQSVISLIPVLAVIMPIFSNTSGTVGIQALTVTITGLSVGKVTPLDTLKILRKEILAGLGTALVLGLTLVMLSLIWAPAQDRWVALVAGLVMAINVLVAVTLGTLLPLGFKQLSLDPALCSGPLLTTLLDGVGFMIFLTLISVALNFLKFPA